jgi:DNA-sulfur modification-associated
MSFNTQFPSATTKEASVPVFKTEGPAHVTISQDLAVMLAQASARGVVLYGSMINQNVISLGIDGYELEAFSPDPNMMEDKKYLAYHPDMEETARIRREVQRLFLKSKKDNARAYSHYAEAVDKGERLGFTPAPILWCKDLLEVIPLGLSNLCVVIIPRGRELIPVDGETQIAGRFQGWQRDESLKDVVFPVIIAHGRTEEWARQTFHDVNVFGVKPNAALAISMDGYDPATQIARELAEKLPFLNGRINMSARQLSKADRESGQIATISSLRGSIVTLEKGITGVAIGAKSMPLHDAEKQQLERWATAWWSALGTHLGAVLTDANSVASAPACMAALGAVGHAVFARGEDPQAVAARLAQEVKWEKGQRWAGIAGKFTPRGAFSLGGAKENSYAIFSALTDPSDDGYSRIRK